MTQLVGILNVTPDSFSDGGRYLDADTAIAYADQLFAAGASLVDIGAESTRPGAESLSTTEEWRRLEPVLNPLARKYKGQLSVDTYHPETAEKALKLKDIIINDVTGMNNDNMVTLICNFNAPCVVSHLPSLSTDIQAAHHGKLIDNVEQVRDELLAKAELLKERGLSHEKIILDPGIGFGKTPELNWELLGFAAAVPDYAVMIGYSRKRFLGDKRLELEPNLAAGRVAIAAGAAYLRVHDVAGHRQLLY